MPEEELEFKMTVLCASEEICPDVRHDTETNNFHNAIPIEGNLEGDHEACFYAKSREEAQRMTEGFFEDNKKDLINVSLSQTRES